MTNEIKETNPGFPNHRTALVWHVPSGADSHDRSMRARLRGSIVRPCRLDGWCILVEARELAEPDTSLHHEDAQKNPLHPSCFGDSSEIRVITIAQSTCVAEACGR